MLCHRLVKTATSELLLTDEIQQWCNISWYFSNVISQPLMVPLFTIAMSTQTLVNHRSDTGKSPGLSLYLLILLITAGWCQHCCLTVRRTWLQLRPLCLSDQHSSCLKVAFPQCSFACFVFVFSCIINVAWVGIISLHLLGWRISSYCCNDCFV